MRQRSLAIIALFLVTSVPRLAYASNDPKDCILKPGAIDKLHSAFKRGGRGLNATEQMEISCILRSAGEQITVAVAGASGAYIGAAAGTAIGYAMATPICFNSLMCSGFIAQVGKTLGGTLGGIFGGMAGADFAQNLLFKEYPDFGFGHGLGGSERRRNQLDECYALYEIQPRFDRLSKLDIDKAYRRAALIWHPDAGGSNEAFLKVSVCKVILYADNGIGKPRS